MAAVAATFARYFLELTHWPLRDSLVSAVALAILTAINCLGVRVGSQVQATLTLIAIATIALLEAVGSGAAVFPKSPGSRSSIGPLR